MKAYHLLPHRKQMRRREKAWWGTAIVAGLLCLVLLIKLRGPVPVLLSQYNYYTADGVLAGDVIETGKTEAGNLGTRWLHAGEGRPENFATIYYTLPRQLISIEPQSEYLSSIEAKLAEGREHLLVRWPDGKTADFRKIARGHRLTMKRGFRMAGYGESLTMTAIYPQFAGSSELERQINPLIQQAARVKLQGIEDYAWRNRTGIKSYLRKELGDEWHADDQWRIISFNTNCTSLLIESHQYTGVVFATVYSVLNFRLEDGTWKMITLAELFKSPATWKQEFSALCAEKILALNLVNAPQTVNEPDFSETFTVAPDGIRIFCTAYNEKQMDAVIFLRWEELGMLLNRDAVERLFPEVRQKLEPSP